MNIEDRLMKLVMYELGVGEEMIDNNSRFVEDLGADELDRVELIIAIEEEFGIAIEDADAEEILTFGDALEYVEKRLSNKDN